MLFALKRNMRPEDVINHYEEKISGATAQDVLRDEVSTMNRIAAVKSVRKILPQIKQCYSFVRDCVNGQYKYFPKKTLTLVVGGLAYLALPNDIVPDFIPAVGWLDDVIVLEWILQQVGSEVKEYAEKSSVRKAV